MKIVKNKWSIKLNVNVIVPIEIVFVYLCMEMQTVLRLQMRHGCGVDIQRIYIG